MKNDGMNIIQHFIETGIERKMICVKSYKFKKVYYAIESENQEKKLKQKVKLSYKIQRFLLSSLLVFIPISITCHFHELFFFAAVAIAWFPRSILLRLILTNEIKKMQKINYESKHNCTFSRKVIRQNSISGLSSLIVLCILFIGAIVFFMKSNTADSFGYIPIFLLMFLIMQIIHLSFLLFLKIREKK